MIYTAKGVYYIRSGNYDRGDAGVIKNICVIFRKGIQQQKFVSKLRIKLRNLKIVSSLLAKLGYN